MVLRFRWSKGGLKKLWVTSPVVVPLEDFIEEVKKESRDSFFFLDLCLLVGNQTT